ncbi:MAG: hypothetical protein OXR66_04350 [Candidatus Woesearchaeota archaeon]|nr:hypothetical protein [Candidatus Woesearchaeota archaeon]
MELTELHELGLSAGQVAVYGAVLELGTTALNKIQEKTGIERRNIYDILNKLIERGLVSYTVESGKKTFQCTHPNKLKEQVEEKQQALTQLHEKIPHVTELFNAAKQEIRAEVYRGNDAVQALLDEALDYDASYWLGGNSGVEKATGEPMKRWWKHWTKRRVKKKHVMYDLVDHGTWLEDFPPNNTQVHKKGYYKYCQLPKDLRSPMVMIIFGNKVVQVLWSKQSFAFVLESPILKESFMKYFNYFWKEPW